ncbi:type IV secretory system conjugative DNA transfer family protein [Stackebrandtia nassauensis]|uniref:Type IV secretory pathway VirD4 protein-like protein n=1 Tax=Stackebrandtia nassauensis (strain DSM 44728 / CIP 108903 / NRRL B-16338 / NBRC 102104 / LLR-40K-21) TaxID=446470 RepID=D3PVU7_STANL|nr:type IV secretory system conjugative DNA transfer family protein [Stackebrandtia nassauensis]ADD45068.1 Type IV secretory pathway VirD4 protein-like protein [Stackebrandtia nassauensis DSM 44728]
MSDHTTVTRPLLSTPAEYAMALLLAAIAITTAWVWSAGQLAAITTSWSWLHVGIGDAFTTALQLPRHLEDPRLAWPITARGQLPGPVGMYAAFVLAGIGYAVLGAVVVRWMAGRRRRRGFASRTDLAKSLTPSAARARAARLRPELGHKPSVRDVSVDLGTAVGTGQKLAAPIDSSVLVLAAPRVGKTSQLIIPWLADWPGPALATSVRRDVADNTYQLRQRTGPVAVLDLTGTSWPDLLAWSPLDGCQGFDKARQRADVMISIGKSESSDSTNAGFFGLTATNLMAGWLHAAAISDATMSDVLRWSLNERDDTPVRILADAGTNAADGIADLLDDIYRSPSDTRSNMWSTVQTGVAPLLATHARRTFCPPPGAGFNIEEFLRQSGTLYVHVADDEAGHLAPLVSAFVDEVTRTAKRIGDAHPTGRIDPPLGMILDEVNNVSPLPNLPSLMSYAAGSGIFIAAVLQSLAGARERWGREGADKLWAAATVKIALGGLPEDELQRFSTLVGEYREKLTTPQYSHHGTHLSTTLVDRKILSPAEIRTLSESEREALVVHATTPAVKARLARHYETKHAKAYAASVEAMQQATTTAPEPMPETTAPWKLPNGGQS